MSYLALARKWRPKSFKALVGQQHVLQALVNALDHQKLHHAYLFSGTRGVGKTTIARIFAKCLNCEKGVSSKPCGACDTCKAIDEGRFFDLIEVDAASRTRLEETKDLLENVQYKPTQGRYKIYLIDEVHMLSNHSFNALLKTLEEPPEYVKFLFATTDPDKLPVTILSRCLQFHLKHMTPEQIRAHLEYVLTEEKINFEIESLVHISKAAKGSMRDALSLLDQAVAYCNGTITTAHIHTMLGSIEKNYIWDLLKALAQKNGALLLTQVDHIAEQTSNFSGVLDDLLSTLHELAVEHIAPSTALDADTEKCHQAAKLFSPEDIQLYYQIGLIGSRDIELAPTRRTGFEMTLIRMLAFHKLDVVPPTKTSSTPAMNTAPPITTPIENKTARYPATNTPPAASSWGELIPKLHLTGLTLSLANHCALKAMYDSSIELTISEGHAPLLNDKQKERLAQALQQHFNKPYTVKITMEKDSKDSPAAIAKENAQLALEKSHQHLLKDENVQGILTAFDAVLDPQAIKMDPPSKT